MLQPITVRGSQTYFIWQHNKESHIGDLFYADAFDIDTLPAGKKGCTLFRYQTGTSKAGGITPAIMINLDSKLVYFPVICDKCGEITGWESRGIKIEIWPEKWDIMQIN